MDDFHNLQPGLSEVETKHGVVETQISTIVNESKKDEEELGDLQARVNSMLERIGSDKRVKFDEVSLDELNDCLVTRLAVFKGLSDADKALKMSPVDYIVAAIAGGVAVVVDFLVVKIPKTGKYLGKFEQKGSPLTALLRKIGQNENGDEAKWVNVLEKCFHVNYDPSSRKGVFGFRDHRVFSPGHDPSLPGFIFAVKDIISGTFTYFDKSGRIVIEKAEEMGLLKKCLAPIWWFGHLLSDLFTSAGIPVPGGTLLRAIQVGKFGKKGRTIGELMQWMYINGYDMRHLASMSTANGAMNLIIGLYLAFISPIDASNSQLLSEREFVTVRKQEKKVKMKLVASSVAVSGNIAKIYAYQGNPNAFNYTLWYEMIKQALSGVTILMKDKSAEEAIEARHTIDENFDVLLSFSQKD